MSRPPMASRTALPPLTTPPGRMPSPSAAVDAAQVMLRYQDLMERFLETQRSLMSHISRDLMPQIPDCWRI